LLARRLAIRLARRVAPYEIETAMRFAEARSYQAFPKRNVQAVDDVPEGGVLVLSPHPDDEAIGMGGTLLRHLDRGADVTVLYLTDGGGLEEPRDRMRAVRRAESDAVGRATGARQVFWDVEDTRLTNDESTVARMVALLKELRPDHVYAPSIFDHHYDHFATNQILVDALARLPGFEGSVAGYEVWDDVPFPNWIVDVSGVVDRKDELLAHYATPHEYTDFTQLCRARTSVHFALYVTSDRARAATGYAEAFLRFDPATYAELHRGWVRALRADGNEQVARLRLD
jgi:LmbE family N-acetylglucosaminyl deacetylase